MESSCITITHEQQCFPFFLPSHTSVWSQPNNCGCNLRFHKCVEAAIKRLCHSGQKNTVWFCNVVIRHAWDNYVKREQRELVNAGSNTTTSSWETTGFYPFNPYPESWRNVLSTLGTLSKEIKKEKREEELVEYDITVKDGGTTEKELTSEEKKHLMQGLPSATSPTEAAYFQRQGMIAGWRESKILEAIPPTAALTPTTLTALTAPTAPTITAPTAPTTMKLTAPTTTKLTTPTTTKPTAPTTPKPTAPTTPKLTAPRLYSKLIPRQMRRLE